MSILVNINNIGGSITKEDDRYTVKDNTLLNNLVVSSTDLKPMKSTSGHNHKGQEEVYFFIRGDGKMELDGKEMVVKEGDTVLIEDGVFHRVHAGPKGCYFVCVFDGKRSH
ncbi:MAG: cupin domain-containing protein [Pelagibacterales bacterium]|jgi:mannose-6-phosphate isomerase-like protein (cupin superfamily)|nr:cupin domain-containing protein [Pelagibacterales bacterium]|tara:strand:+ start:1781 stop:2113 length:333 start_codon:yes stop_codon:yes gene_type:complete